MSGAYIPPGIPRTTYQAEESRMATHFVVHCEDHDKDGPAIRWSAGGTRLITHRGLYGTLPGARLGDPVESSEDWSAWFIIHGHCDLSLRRD